MRLPRLTAKRPLWERVRLPRVLRRRSAAERTGVALRDAALHSAKTTSHAVHAVARTLSPAKAPRPKPAEPAAHRPPSRREVKARLKVARENRRAARWDGLSLLGFVAIAGLIVAWPRPEGSPFKRYLDVLRGGGVLGPPETAVAAAERAEPSRGRSATHPLVIPRRGWRDIGARVMGDFGRDRIMATAGGVTFFSLLALFPAMAAFVSLYGLFADVHTAREQLRLLAGFMPHDILSFVGDEILRLADGKKSGLGIAFVISLLFSLWSANGAVKALFDGLNVAYEERERRSFVQLNLISLAFTLGAIVFAVLALAAIVAAPVAIAFLRRRLGLDVGLLWWAELRWPLMLALLAGCLSLLYRFGPSRAQARWMWLTPGSLFAAVMWLAASLAFSFYVANFGHYNATYGSLGAAIGFMTWLWYSTIIVLVGAELNSEIEHQTAVDTTTGPAKAMGDRGAKMADTLGETRAQVKADKVDRPPPRPPQARMA